ncbi:hypothetical protein IKG64_02325 [Candidatus Saccharibacteria bacterium]|nr:hypothetical protein [Candidatus Saccharibacteria bacterium]
MAVTVDELQVLISAKTDEFQKELNKTQKQLTNFSNSFKSISGGVATMAVTAGNLISKAIEKTVSVVTQNIDYAVKRLDSLNRFPIVMENLGISATEATNAINSLAEYTLGLPTTLNDAAEKVQYFTSATGNVWQSIKIFEALNDAIVSGAQTADVQSTALYQWSQAIVRGSFDIEREFNAMVVANAKAVNEISEKLLGTGKNFNDLWSALKNGTVTVYDMVDAMVYLDENGVGGLESWATRARNSVAGIDTALIRLKTNIGKAVAVVASEIGWKNIYTFVNNVGDAIYKAGTYVAAFVRVLKEAFAWVHALFGGSGSTADIVTETGEAASNAASMASGASDTADGFDDAAKSAKKLNKQLAAFDEMNTLQEQTSSGSGSSGSGGGGGSYNFDWDSGVFESAADKIAALAEKIKAALAGIFDIDALKDAFAQFVADAQVFLDPVIQIIRDVWNDYIKPMLTWAGNSLLPAALNAIGGALALVGKTLKKYWNKYLKPFIDDFLVPIAKWTGGKIVKILNEIGDGLRYLSQREDVVNIIAAGIHSLGLAMAGIKVAEFFTEFGKGVAIFTKVWDAGLGVGTAMGAVASQTTGLTSIMASLAQGPLTFLQNGFSKLWSIITNHPIITIIAVIGALMLTNEDLRNALKNLLDSVLTPIMNLLSSIMSVLQPIFDVLVNLLSAVLTPVIGTINILAELLSVVLNALSPILEFIMNIVVALLELPLELIKEGVAAINFVLGIITGLLEGVFGWLFDLLGITNDNTDANKEYKKSLSEVEQQYDKNGDGALDYAERVVYLNKCINEENSAEEDLIQAERSQIETMKKLQEYVTKYNVTADELIRMHREGRLSELAQGEALDDLKLAVIDVEQANYKVNEAQEKYTTAQGEAQSQANQLKEEYDRLGQELLDLVSEQGFVNDEFDTQSEKLKNIQEEIKKTGKNVGEMRNWSEEARQAGMKIGDGLSDGLTCKVPDAQRAGRDTGQGYINGLNSQNQAAWNAGYGIGSSGISGIRAGAVVKSPSKAAREIGGYVGEGLVLGLEDEMTPVERAAELLAETAIDALTPLTDLSVDFPIANGKTDAMDMLENSNNDNDPVHVTVNVGEDTLIDKVVTGINDLSYISNRAVVNV